MDEFVAKPIQCVEKESIDEWHQNQEARDQTQGPWGDCSPHDLCSPTLHFLKKKKNTRQRQTSHWSLKDLIKVQPKPWREERSNKHHNRLHLSLNANDFGTRFSNKLSNFGGYGDVSKDKSLPHLFLGVSANESKQSKLYRNNVGLEHCKQDWS